MMISKIIIIMKKQSSTIYKISKAHKSVRLINILQQKKLKLPSLAMIPLSAVQLFTQILIHKAILFINTSTIRGTTNILNWAAMLGDHCQ